MAPEAQKVEETGIHWFGEYDMHPRTGRPASDFPTDYNDHAVREMEKEIHGMERAVEDDVFKGRDLRNFKEKLAMKKKRLNDILAHRVQVEKRLKANGVYKKVQEAYDELGEKISDSLFTQSSMMRMTDDPQIEANRMEGPCIEIKNPVVKELCDQAGYPLSRGKISRTRADIIRKIMGKHLGVESRDIEVLRRPDNDTRGRKLFQVPEAIS